jgi:hypothetical protein
MVDTSTNDATHTPVNRVQARTRPHNTPASAGAAAPGTDAEHRERATAELPASGAEHGARGAAQTGAHVSNSGRDERGRFAKGNLGGPGNPHARRVAQFRRALWNAVTDDDIEAIVRRQIEKAREGDSTAAKLVLAYTVGKPVPTVDADTLDQQEWEILKNTPVPMDEFEQPLTGMPKSLACDLNRIAIPCLRQQYGEVIKPALFADDATYAAMCAGTHPVGAATTADSQPEVGEAKPVQASPVPVETAPNRSSPNRKSAKRKRANCGRPGRLLGQESLPNIENGGHNVAAPSPNRENGGHGAAVASRVGAQGLAPKAHSESRSMPPVGSLPAEPARAIT